jgi:hypothetical protein
MTFKTFKFPDSVPVEKAAVAWGVEAEPLYKFSATDTLTSHELRKFLMKTTAILHEGKPKPAFKEYFVRFMVLSLKYPLIEDTEKAILQLLDRDYLTKTDEDLFRKKCHETYENFDKRKIQRFILEQYEKFNTEYIAQFPKRILIEMARDIPFGTQFQVGSKISPQMGVNLAICGIKMGITLALIPIADQVSLEIIESNPLAKSFAPLIGSLRMRAPIADRHTGMAIG